MSDSPVERPYSHDVAADEAKAERFPFRVSAEESLKPMALAMGYLTPPRFSGINWDDEYFLSAVKDILSPSLDLQK